MSNTLEYILNLSGNLEDGLRRIKIENEQQLATWAKVERQMNESTSIMNNVGRSIGSMTQHIEALRAQKQWIPASNTEAIRATNHEIKALSEEIDHLNSLNGGKLAEWADDLKNSLPAWATNPLAQIGTAAFFSGKSAMSFEEGMANVNVTAQLDEAGLSDLKKQVAHIAVKNKMSIELAPAGFEKILGQTDDVELSLSILDTAMKGARGTFTDVDTVSGALAQTLSVVGKENASASEVLDTLISARKVGAAEFKDFAQYVPNLIASGANLGVNYKEAAGAFAFMTAKGQSAERASVLLQNTFSLLGKGDVTEKLKAYGIAVYDSSGKMRGMADIFGDVNGKIAGMTDEQKAKWLESVGIVDKEARAAFSLLSSDVGRLGEVMDETASATGATDQALRDAQNPMMLLSDLWTTLENLGTEIGLTVMPVISGALVGLTFVLDGVLSGFSWLKDNLPLIIPLFTGLAIAVLAYNKGALAMAAITKISTLWTTIQTAATSGLTFATTALNIVMAISPLGWIAIGFGIVVTAVMLLWNKFEGFREVVMGTWEVIKTFGQALWEGMIAPFKLLFESICAAWKALKQLFSGDFSGAWDSAKTASAKVAEAFMSGGAVGVAKAAGDGKFGAAWEAGKEKGRASWATDHAEEATPKSPIEIPVTPVVTNDTKIIDFKNKDKGNGSGGNGKGTKTLDLNELSAVQDYSQSAGYAAATSRFMPGLTKAAASRTSISRRKKAKKLCLAAQETTPCQKRRMRCCG